jgi:hypothetical protein
MNLYDYLLSLINEQGNGKETADLTVTYVHVDTPSDPGYVELKTDTHTLEVGKTYTAIRENDTLAIVSTLTVDNTESHEVKPTTIAQTFREVHLVTFEPQGGEGGVGGMTWYHTREAADFQFETLVGDSDYANDLVAQWNAYVPAEWGDRDVITDYLDETFVGEVPSGFPIRVHNAPHENWPHQDD